jgi:uncharacterized membrane protein YgcG
VLLDERADTLDVSATIVDLAVRGYLQIAEIPKAWLFGSVDYRLKRLKEPDADLLTYEKALIDALFEGKDDTVTMSSLEDNFYTDLASIKEDLYGQVVNTDRFFPRSPDKVRQQHVIVGLILFGLGVFGSLLIGKAIGGAIMGVPAAISGALLALFAGAMPRRTGAGREVFRRVLGFREYMEVAETERQRFAEQAGLFQSYLPYAIVFGCTEKWAKAFEGLEEQPVQNGSGWYVSSRPFAPVAFAHNLDNFSSSISSAISSTPASSGSSGSGGGGSSGGGMGGGGGGSW